MEGRRLTWSDKSERHNNTHYDPSYAQDARPRHQTKTRDGQTGWSVSESVTHHHPRTGQPLAGDTGGGAGPHARDATAATDELLRDRSIRRVAPGVVGARAGGGFQEESFSLETDDQQR